MAGESTELKDHPIIRYTGMFDYDALYNSILGWYKAKGFARHEKKYVHKGKELEFEWYGFKEVTKYVRYEITVEMFVWEFGKLEAIVDGQKKIMNKGRLQLVIKGKYILDYKGQWETGGFVKFLRDIYHKYLIQTYIIFEVHTPLYKLLYDFYDTIRKVLGMENIK